SHSTRGARTRLYQVVTTSFSSAGDETLPFQRAGESVERFVDLVPAREAAHAIEPARDVRIRSVRAADELAGFDHHRAEVVCDRDALAAHVCVAANQIAVEHLEPALSALEAAIDQCLLRGRIGEAEVRQHLRIDERVAEVAIELG